MSGIAKTIVRDQAEKKENIQGDYNEKIAALLDKLRSGEKLTIDEAQFLSALSVQAKQDAESSSGVNSNIAGPEREYKPDGSAKKVDAAPLPEADDTNPKAEPNSPITVGSANSEHKGHIEKKKPGNVKTILDNDDLLGYLVYKVAQAKSNGAKLTGGQYGLNKGDYNVILEAIKKAHPEANSSEIKESFQKCNNWLISQYAKMQSPEDTVEAFKRFSERPKILAEKRAARAEENLDKALSAAEEGSDKDKATASSKSFANRQNKTDLYRMTSGDKNQEVKQALRNATQNVDTVANMMKNNRLNSLLDAAKQGDYSKESWEELLKAHPNLSLRFNPQRKMLDDSTLRFVASYNDENPVEGAEKEKAFSLLTSNDIKNFLSALAGKHVPRNYVTDTGVDDSAGREVKDRIEQAISHADPAFLNTSRKRMYDWDPATGSFVETADFAKKNNKDLSQIDVDDSYIDHVVNALKLNKDGALSRFISGEDLNDTNPIVPEYQIVKNRLGNTGGAEKFKKLLSDIADFNSFTTGDVDKSTFDYDPFTVRMLRNKFKKLRDDNKLPADASLKDLFEYGDAISLLPLLDVLPDSLITVDASKSPDAYREVLEKTLGKTVAPELDPKDYKDLLTGTLKMNKYRNSRAKDIKGLLDPSSVKQMLKYNIDEYRNMLDSNDFTRIPGMDAAKARDVLGTLLDARDLLLTPTETEEMLGSGTLDREEPLSLRDRLSDEDKEKFDQLTAKKNDIAEELALHLKANEGKAGDDDETKLLRDDLAKVRHEIASLDKSLDDASTDDYFNELYRKANFDAHLKELMNKYPTKMKGALTILSKLGETYPDQFPDIQQYLDNIDEDKKPLTDNEIINSQKAAMDVLGMTPAEWAAVVNNKNISAKKNNVRYTDKMDSVAEKMRKATEDTFSDAKSTNKYTQDMDYASMIDYAQQNTNKKLDKETKAKKDELLKSAPWAKALLEDRGI